MDRRFSRAAIPMVEDRGAFDVVQQALRLSNLEPVEAFDRPPNAGFHLRRWLLR